MDVGANIQNLIFCWYDNIEKQNYQKNWCNGDFQTAPLITPHNKLLPFQIKRAAYNVDTDDLTWIMINVVTGETVDLKALLPADFTTLYIRTTGEVDYIVYDATQSFNIYLTGGYWYSVMSDGLQTWYSEVFMIGCFVDPADAGTVIGIDEMGGGLIIEEHGSWNDFLLADSDDVVAP